jgi:glutamate/tyrosine decarboxylase-like PLP-dependent enzyme
MTLLERTTRLAQAWLDSLPTRRVGPAADFDAMHTAFDAPLPEAGKDPERIISELAAAAEPGLMGSAGPRFFGFVMGGTLPAGVAADWLVTSWDQIASSTTMSPASMAIEGTAARWALDLLGLPAGASVGFVTGATAGNTVGLAAARHHVLGEVGWDVEADGLVGAPPVRVLAGDEVHVSVLSALRIVGLGERRIVRVPVDGNGAMRADALAAALREGDGPTIVCAQAGNVNTGAVDPLEAIVAAAREHGAWVHVDGAFGLWAAASPSLAPLVRGAAAADSWAVDAHKWLNAPYDCALAVVGRPEAHRAAMGVTAPYLAGGPEHNMVSYVPEMSRRARGVPVYAAMRSLGRAGVADLVERCCAHARRLAAAMDAEPGVEVLNDVVLNQVLLRFSGDDEVTRAVVAGVQADGDAWLGGTVWRGRAAVRVSVSNWQTTEADMDRLAGALRRAHAAAAAAPAPAPQAAS